MKPKTLIPIVIALTGACASTAPQEDAESEALKQLNQPNYEESLLASLGLIGDGITMPAPGIIHNLNKMNEVDYCACMESQGFKPYICSDEYKQNVLEFIQKWNRENPSWNKYLQEFETFDKIEQEMKEE